MKSNDIKVGHIYYVNFEPTRKGEFPGNHLAVVLKKNNDSITFVVLPMTSKDSGNNKIELGYIESLPSNLKEAKTYLVLDQIRTVHSSRFYQLKDNDKPIDVEVPKDKWEVILKSVLADLLRDIPSEIKESVFKQMIDKTAK